MKRTALGCTSLALVFTFTFIGGAVLAQSARDSDRRSDRYNDIPQFIDPPPSQWATRPGDPSPTTAPVPGTANPYATVPGTPNYWGTTAGASNPWQPKVGAPNPSDANIGKSNPWATVPGAPSTTFGTAPTAQNPQAPQTSSKPQYRYSDERMTPAGRASPDRAPTYSGRH